MPAVDSDFHRLDVSVFDLPEDHDLIADSTDSLMRRSLSWDFPTLSTNDDLERVVDALDAGELVHGDTQVRKRQQALVGHERGAFGEPLARMDVADVTSGRMRTIKQWHIPHRWLEIGLVSIGDELRDTNPNSSKINLLDLMVFQAADLARPGQPVSIYPFSLHDEAGKSVGFEQWLSQRCTHWGLHPVDLILTPTDNDPRFIVVPETNGRVRFMPHRRIAESIDRYGSSVIHDTEYVKANILALKGAADALVAMRGPSTSR